MILRRNFVLDNNIYEVESFVKRLGTLVRAYLSPEDLMKFSLGIAEIIINAVEHGNLEINYEEKSSLLKEGTYFDQLRERAENSKYKGRKINISLCADENKIEVTVSDSGCGFDWRKYFQDENRNILDFHGRGLKIARFYLDEIVYNETGNEVKVVKIPTGKKCK